MEYLVFAMTDDDSTDDSSPIFFDWLDPNSELAKNAASQINGFLPQFPPLATANFDNISGDTPFAAVRRSDKVASFWSPEFLVIYGQLMSRPQ